jgi:hypothetical protein
LVVKHVDHWPSWEKENQRYQLHQNDPKDPAYASYLIKSWNSLSRWYSSRDSVLDFGCGPQKALEEILFAQGTSVMSFDPHFFPDIPKQKFSLIFCHETFEHFRQPRETILQLISLGEPNFKLYIRTEPTPTHGVFKDWAYANDTTHLHFWSQKSIAWMSDHFQFTSLGEGRNFWILQKTIVS